MAAWKSTPDERAQAAQLVLTRVENGETLANSVRHFARALEVSEETLRRWVRQEKAGTVPAMSVAEPAAEAVAASVATAVLERPSEAPATRRFDELFEATADQQPEASRSTPRRTLRRVVAAVAAAVSALVGFGVVANLHTSGKEKAAERVADYVSGKGTHDYVATDSNFRVSFPFGMPQRSAESHTVGPVTVEYVAYGTESDSGAFSVGSFVLPPGVPYDLNAGVNGASVAIGGHIESATATTFQGSPAIEFVITGTDSGRQFVDKGIVVDAGSRVYLLQTLWENTASPGYDAFKASFHIGL